MSILNRKSPSPATLVASPDQHHASPDQHNGERQLQPGYHRLSITVVFTTTRATLEALRRAGELAHELGAEIRIVAAQVTPYPLPIDAHPVNRQHFERRFHTLVPPYAIETRVEVVCCRDEQIGISQALQPHSLVIIGGRMPWWPTKARRLARLLSRAGHHVVFVEQDQRVVKP